MKRVLFVCSQNALRSPTAERVFCAHRGIDVESAGTSAEADTPLTATLVAWADLIFVMEEHHRAHILGSHAEASDGKQIVVLDIPDRYGFMEPELVRLLEQKVAPHLPAPDSATEVSVLEMRADPQSLSTAAGRLELIPKSLDSLRGVARYWPMEVLANPDTPGHFGLVFQRGEVEVHGVKLQPIDFDEKNAMTLHTINCALIASALPHYLARGHRGVMVPCAYYKKKGDETFESGIAIFVGPDPGSRRGATDAKGILYDDVLGEGATPMVLDMVFAMRRASQELDLPMMTIIGMDVRPRMDLGGLAMYFVVEGSRAFVVKDPLRSDDPIWEYVVRAGFTRLPYAPMFPAALAAAPDSSFPHA